MDERSLEKINKLMIGPTHKINIIEEFKRVINQVDIDAETILMKIHQNESQESTEMINQTRKMLIGEIENIKEHNLDHLSKLSVPSENFEIENKDLFVKHCVFLSSDVTREFTLNKTRLGILVVTDFYITEDQADSLSKTAPLILKIDFKKINYQENICFNQMFAENLLILKALRTSINNDSYIVNFSKKKYSEIEKVLLTYTSSQHSLEIIRFDSVFSRFTCLKDLTLECIDLNHIKKDLLVIKSLETLVLNSCRIEFIEDFSFRNLENLKILSLIGNHLKSLESKVFYGLSSLESLDLSSNRINELKVGLFSELKSLKSLYLDSHGFKNPITNNMFHALGKLEDLQLVYQLGDFVLEKNLFKGLDNLKNLTVCDFTDTKQDENNNEVDPPLNLEELHLHLSRPDSFLINWISKAEHLKKLKFEFPHHINNSSVFHNLHNLEEIVLEKVGLNIDHFPSDLNKLRVVEMNWCKFLDNPENLFSFLSSLEQVDLNYCKFKSVQDNRKLFENLKNLKKLTYITNDKFFNGGGFLQNTNQKNDKEFLSSDNKFITTDLIVKNHPQLMHLDLSYNHDIILSLKSFRELNLLETLILSSNKIERLDDELFNGLTNLKKLSLDCNKLSLISDNLFNSDLKTLVKLHLFGNELSNLPNGVFSNLVSLEILDLSSNMIKNIEKDVFENLNNLKVLFMTDNQIEELSNQLFRNLYNLEDIDLTRNKLRNVDNLFDCNLKLESICLEHNRIESIDFISLAKLKNIRDLKLRNNAIANINLDEINYFTNSVVEDVDICLYENPVLQKVHLHNFQMSFKFD